MQHILKKRIVNELLENFEIISKKAYDYLNNNNISVYSRDLQDSFHFTLEYNYNTGNLETGLYSKNTNNFNTIKIMQFLNLGELLYNIENEDDVYIYTTEEEYKILCLESLEVNLIFLKEYLQNLNKKGD